MDSFSVISIVLFQIRLPSIAHPLDNLSPPHCTRNSVILGEMLDEVDEQGKSFRIQNPMKADLGLKETVCFLIKANESSAVEVQHSIEMRKLELHYPISGRYQFGIPAISTKCKCDCAGGDQHCLIDEYNYKYRIPQLFHGYRNCTRSSSKLCYRTYRAAQSAIGCFSDSSKSEVCCEIHIAPYKQWIFQALRLTQPDIVVVLEYRIYEKLGEGKKWRLANRETIETIIHKGRTHFQFHSGHNVDVSVFGSPPHRKMEPGMYFLKEGDDHQLRQGARVNDLDETNMDKMGWFRREQGEWNIRKGLIKVTDAQHVTIVDCKAQKYETTLNAEQFVLLREDGDEEEAEEHLDLGKLVTDNAWVQSIDARGGRTVRVEHGEGTTITLSILTRSRPFFIQHSSQFQSFNATIMLDAESNRFLNTSFKSAKGTLIGNVYTKEDRRHSDLVFSVSLGGDLQDSATVITLPSTVNSTRWVCFHAAGDSDGESCAWVDYLARPMTEYRVPHRWQTASGQCLGCNERGMENFMLKFNPRQWLDGVNSPTEFFAILFEGAILVVAGLLIVAILTKCVIPLLRWTCCTGSAPRK